MMNYLWIILCQIIVGSSYPIAKEAVDNVPELVLACVTLGLASLLLMPIAAKVDKTKWSRFGKERWIKVGFQSLCACVLYTVFLFLALSHASATVSGIFNGLAPAIVFVLSPFIVHEKLNLKKGLSILLAIAAVVIISVVSSENGGTDIMGVVFLLLSAISVSLFTVFSKKFTVDDLKPVTAAAGVCFSGFVITAPFAVVQTLTSGFDYSVFFDGRIAAETVYYGNFRTDERKTGLEQRFCCAGGTARLP